MPIFIRVGLAALLSIALVYVGPQLLGGMLAFLPDAFYEALPMHPFILILLLSGLLAGICLALMAPNRRLVTSGLVAFGLIALGSISFYNNLCSPEETQRIHDDWAAIPQYNLGQPLDQQPLQFGALNSVSYDCLLPETGWDSAGAIAGDLLTSFLGVALGILLVPRRRQRPTPEII
ncbi:hypothetical protein [Ectopseudomonas alcaliphila]|uniref:Uncharacterized protein n=1 Tax=Ectopseudomonas alcaliphila TaxID=101564 RepID=A0A1G7N1N1_9GAMM|nr:hypothetical protein [Pseudomonas alcaliphila]MDX5994861.1 hypothetical protein [Pseudomonas alcaliphila]SDF67259.1 hypothetical protein SAMN05216575_109161 [Pseudomonas alcaliphila]